MHIKYHLLSFMVSVVLTLPIQLNAQTLSREHHVPIQTDSLLAYKLPCMPISGCGQNQTWDFSNMPLDSAETIELNYFPISDDSVRIGLHREHANIYYRYAHDTMWITGYETSYMHVQYSDPLAHLRFPFMYGDSLCGTFTGKGKYCHQQPLTLDGSYMCVGDATGILVLPDMIVDSVIRIHSQIRYRYMESVRERTYTEDSYRWYSSYSRYPLLEIVQKQAIENQDTLVVASSYYFPQEEAFRSPRLEKKTSTVESVDSLISNVVYLPNPVHTELQIHYSLVRRARVYISVHYNGGASTYQTAIHQEEEGPHSVSINMAGIPMGTYVVYIHADDTVVSGNIIKL